MSPKRASSHVLEEKARRAVRNVLPPEWVIHDVREDYGEDYHVEIYREGLPTGYEFAIQIKGTDSGSKAHDFTVQLPWKTVRYLSQRPMPAIIAGYNGTTDAVHFIWLSEYLTGIEYAGRLDRTRASLTVHFTEDTLVSGTTPVTDILDYFEIAGAPPDRVKQLLEQLPRSGASERYKILRELRFLRSHDGVIYLLSLFGLDLMLASLGYGEEVDQALTRFLSTCLGEPTPAATMLFWGAAADHAEHSGYSVGQRVFTDMLPKMLAMSPRRTGKANISTVRIQHAIRAGPLG